MKAQLVFGILVLSLWGGWGSALKSVEIRDLPEDNPAYDIVIYLVDEGFLTLFDGDEFRGDLPMTRIEVALVVDRMLRRVSNGTITPTGTQAEALRILGDEFREEIIRFDDKMLRFDARLAKIEAEQPQILEDVILLSAEVEDRLAAFAAELEILRADMENRAPAEQTLNRLDSLESRVDAIELRLEELTGRTSGGKEAGQLVGGVPNLVLGILVLGAVIALG
ncbi:S-layer homology domain-containing protein [bacterium]|nr:S-layer homology domain-containing protein [bacterium]